MKTTTAKMQMCIFLNDLSEFRIQSSIHCENDIRVFMAHKLTFFKCVIIYCITTLLTLDIEIILKNKNTFCGHSPLIYFEQIFCNHFLNQIFSSLQQNKN